MRTDRSLPPERTGEEGFVLALVVLLLFAVALTGATGYTVVTTEAFQAQQSSEVGQALAVAQGGMTWFTGSQRGLVPDTTTYTINGGTATITTRKVATLSDEQDMYLVKSEGSYTDPRYPSIPATRIVSQYAIFHKVPMNVMAPVITSGGRTTVERNGEVFANDMATPGSCTSAVGATLIGIVARNDARILGTGTIVGSPQWFGVGNFATVTDSVDTRWDVYSNPDFPVDYDDVWPSFGSLPSDSFPVVRVNGNFSPNWSKWGRGVLIVTGDLNLNAWTFWTWYGIILVGDINNINRNSYGNIYGALVGGMGSQMGNWDIEGSTIQYHSCYVESAGLSLAHLSPMENSWWEDTGG
jgi:hypothetical protein